MANEGDGKKAVKDLRACIGEWEKASIALMDALARTGSSSEHGLVGIIDKELLVTLSANSGAIALMVTNIKLGRQLKPDVAQACDALHAKA